MKPLRAGVIGLGVGEQHLRSYRSIDGVEVHAVCDIDRTHLRHIASRYEVPKSTESYREITEDPDIDVVSICSYDDAHADQILSAIRAGKHVMVEKPAVLHRSDAEAVLRALDEAKTLLTSNLILRKSPRFREVKRLADAGEFGRVFCIEGDYIHQILWKLTEGWRGKMAFYCTFYGGGVHLVDLMRWILGDEVREVAAMGTDLLTRGSQYRYPDTISALLRFNGGALGKCLTTLGPQRTKFHALNVYGDRMTFVNDLPDAKIFTSDRPEDERRMDVPYPGVEKGDFIPDFIEAIREGRRPEVDAADIFRVMDVCFAVWDAVQTGRTVKVDYLI